MKIKRFVAPDMRRAIRKVREEQGPDAVILSNRKVIDGIEIIAAVDYDEALIHHALGPIQRPPMPDHSELDTSTEVDSPIQKVSETTPVNFLPEAPEPKKEMARDIRRQEPTLVEMSRELKTLRTMMQSQLSSLVWNDIARRHPYRAEALRDLSGLGLSPDLAREIASEMPDSNGSKQARSAPLALLARRIPVSDQDDLITQGGVAAILGPTGVGKTTTVAKLAARFALSHGKDQVALVTTDGIRIGAQEQLITFGRILGVPVHTAIDSQSLEQALVQVRDKKLVLIDTAGMSQRDMRLTQQLAGLRGTGVKLFLALAANSQFESLEEVAALFCRESLDGCIITKLDEAAQLGGVLTTVIRRQLPIAYFTDGQRVPEDLHEASKKRLWLVNRAVELTQQADETIAEESMAKNSDEVEASAYA